MPAARTPLLCLAVLVALSGASPAQDARPKGEKYALVVGVRKYDPKELKPLAYAEADATGVADVLKANGYRPENVVLMTQTAGAEEARFIPTGDRIRKELALLARSCGPDDSLVVAFAGHGVQFANEEASYFCPLDARLADRSTLLPLAEVYAALANSPAGSKLLMVDACRNDPLTAFARSRPEVDLESVSRPQMVRPPGGVAAFFSCSEGEKAFEHDDLRHGVFFHFVIEALSGKAAAEGADGVTLQDMEPYVMRRVRDFVRAKYGVDQVPERIGRSRGLLPIVSIGSAAEAYNRGKALASRRDYDGALSEYDLAIRLDPKSADYHASRGYLRNIKGDRDGAMADFSEALRLSPRSGRVRFNRGVLREAKNDLKGALIDYDEAIRLVPNYADAYCNRGVVRHRIGDAEGAFADFGEAIRINPRLSYAFNNRGFAYQTKGDYARAIADFTEAIRLDPGSVGGYTNRADAYRASGDDARARDDRAMAKKLESQGR